VALPLRARNGLAALVLGALHDRGAREALEAVAALDIHPQARGDTALPASLPADIVERHGSRLSLAPGLEAHRSEIIERARRGAEALRGRPFSADTPSLGAALAAAGWLFDARLYFEVHEHLEPHWSHATGETRESLQGLIQVAVGFEHLAGGNVAGAIALLHDGCARILGRRLADVDLDPFARAVRRSLDEVIARGQAAHRFDWGQVPRFPTAS
jgi:hypothetical protein